MRCIHRLICTDRLKLQGLHISALDTAIHYTTTTTRSCTYRNSIQGATLNGTGILSPLTRPLPLKRWTQHFKWEETIWLCTCINLQWACQSKSPFGFGLEAVRKEKGGLFMWRWIIDLLLPFCARADVYNFTFLSHLFIFLQNASWVCRDKPQCTSHSSHDRMRWFV